MAQCKTPCFYCRGVGSIPGQGTKTAHAAKKQKKIKKELILMSGEGDGNPLQCSCLENPRDGGAWWAAVCGVTQSQTRLK